jgi:hypothetical protein
VNLIFEYASIISADNFLKSSCERGSDGIRGSSGCESWYPDDEEEGAIKLVGKKSTEQTCCNAI